MKFYFILIFISLFFISNILYSYDKQKFTRDSVVTYFFIRNKNCNSCCFSAIKIIQKEINKYYQSKYILILDESNKNSILTIKHLLNPDTVIISNHEKFKNIKIISNLDIFVFDKNDDLLFHFINFNNTIPIIKIIRNFLNSKTYIWASNEKIILDPIVSPFLDNQFNLFLIQPVLNEIYIYNIKKEKFIDIISYSEKEKYFLLDTNKEKKEYWDMLFENYKGFIHNYFILQNSDKYLKILTSNICGYQLKKTAKKLNFKICQAIYVKNKRTSKSKFIKLPEELTVNPKLISSTMNINDSIIYLSFIDKYKYNNLIVLLNLNTNKLLLKISLDSIFFRKIPKMILAAGDNKNNLYLLDKYLKEFIKITLLKNNKVRIKRLNNIIDSNSFESIYHFFVDSTKLFLICYIGKDQEKIILKVYDINNTRLLYETQLNNNKKYSEFSIPVRILDNKLYMLSINGSKEPILESYPILKDN